MSECCNCNCGPKTYIEYIVDASGSMGNVRSDVVTGFNTYVEEMKRGQDTKNVRLSLTTFNTDIKRVFQEKRLAELPVLTEHDYVPSGMTALLDTVGDVVNRRRNAMNPDDRVLVVIMTDGAENSSREYTTAKVKALIEDLSDKNFTFTFAGANIDAWGVAHSLGINSHNTISFHATRGKMNDNFRGMATASLNYTSAMAAGASASATFYRQTDGENMDLADVKLESITPDTSSPTTTNSDDGK